jgi:drug/metabolite transporter (DMT)-like permease
MLPLQGAAGGIDVVRRGAYNPAAVNQRTFSRRAGFALALAAAFCWSFTGPGISYLLIEYQVPRLTLAFWRDVFIALVMLPLTLRWFGLPSRAELLRLVVAGVIFIGAYHGLWVFSVGYNGAAIAVVLVYTFPTFATLGAWLLWRERPSAVAAVGLALAFVGCALVVEAYNPEVLALNWLGIVCGLGTGVTQAGYTLFSQRALRHSHPLPTLAWTMTFGALALLLTQRPSTILAVGDQAWPWLVLAAVGIGPTLGGYVLYSLALRRLPAGSVGTIVTLEAPFAALLSARLLGEWLSWPQSIGVLCIVLGAVLPQLQLGRRATEPQSEADACSSPGAD